MGAQRGAQRQRQLLLENWHICSMPAGTAAPPRAAPGWLPIPRLAPAAAALRELGRWSLDAPMKDFDALDWWYRLEFDAPGGWREGALLGFDGLATAAQVWLNGKPLLASTNMFVAHQCETAPLLEEKGNELLMRFDALQPQLAVRRKRPRWRAPMVPQQQLRWFRTTLLGRTPGWSPPAPVVGPWKDIWLECGHQGGIRNVELQTAVEARAGLVDCRVELDLPAGMQPPDLHLRLERAGHAQSQRLQWNAAGRRFEGRLRLDHVDLWWPHTHGEPALYEASVVLGSGTTAQNISIGRLGFRTLAVDTAGGAFSLSVNGVPVFCRGACWMPLDAVTLRSTREACGAAVGQARAAGMNMLRVPGTTVYEEDHFYDACDEQGILVWQEFMFANMDYPAADPEFSASVELEARQQLRRLHGRPCLAVLCGNSEVEQQAAMWGAPRENWASALFTETLPRLCGEMAPATFYWPSSAHGGAFPHQANQGTTSYYGVGAYLRPLADARQADLKFATECLAFANVPAPCALARMPGGLATRVHHPAWKERSPRDLGAGWDFDDVRDHYLGLLFNTDARRLRFADHDRYLALGRVATGEVMAASFAEWRRPASRCGGALVLMLRDLWAGAGWGVVDDAGMPKACYHYLRRALQPVTVLLTDEGVNGLFAHVINESPESLSLELELSAWRNGDVKVAGGKRAIALAARGSCSVSGVELLDHFMDLSYAYRFGLPPCDAVVATLRDCAGQQLAQAFHFPGGLPATQESDVGLSATVRSVDEVTAELTVRARRLALGVHFEIPGALAQHEYFHLAPNAEASVILQLTDGKPPSGSVHAINSGQSVRLEAAAARSGHVEQTR